MGVVRLPLSRSHWQRTIAGLDPKRDWLELSTITAGIEFPWDVQRATELALFRTFAVPEIGELLARTGAFTEATQKRFSDTLIILDGAGAFIAGDEDSRVALQRLNRMHGAYDIPNDQMIYVLTTFVVPLVRWVNRYGYRSMTHAEVEAMVRYWQRMAELMGLKDVPADFDGFASFMDEYERDRFGSSTGGAAVAEATLNLFGHWYPAPLRPVIRKSLLALLDPPVRATLGYPAPSRLTTAFVHALLGARGRFIRMLPARREPVRAAKNRRVRGYPFGWELAAVGTFPETATNP
jgi:uncharacterized protein (DUF2236 family)